MTWREVVTYIRTRYPRATVTENPPPAAGPNPKQKFIDVRVDNTLIIIELNWMSRVCIGEVTGVPCYVRPLGNHGFSEQLRALTTVCDALDKLPV